MNLLDYLSFRFDIVIRIVAFFVLCVVFFRLVRRGKWIKWSHPVCSACGHNLTGLPESSTNCPECGGELAKVRRTAIWRRRWVALGVAAIFFVVCLGIVTAIAWVNIDKAPNFVLMWMRGDNRVRKLIWSRMQAGELSVAQQVGFVDAEAGSNRLPFRKIQLLHERGMISDVAWKRYVWWMLGVGMRYRTAITADGPVVVQLFPQSYLDPSSNVRLIYRLYVDIEGRRIDGPEIQLPSLHGEDPQPQPAIVEIPPEISASFAPGSHSVSLTIDGRAVDKGDSQHPIATRKSTTPMTVLVVAKPERSKVAVKGDENLKAGQPSARALSIYRDGSCPIPEGNWEAWLPEMRTKAYCYKLIAQEDGQEYEVGTLAMSSNEWHWWPAKSAHSIHGPKCDVIFRPDVEGMKRTIGIDQIVDEEFVAHDVVVRQSYGGF